MIKNIIYVEDGSIDVEELEETLGEDTKIIVYRQGSLKPVVEQLTQPIKTDFDDYQEKFNNKLVYIKKLFNELYQLPKTKKVDSKVKEIYSLIFED